MAIPPDAALPAPPPGLQPLVDPVFVMRPRMPSLPEYVALLEELWVSRHLTNAGALEQRLVRRLAAELEVEHLSLFHCATSALMVALAVLPGREARDARGGEVITTPFTFPATINAIHWNGLTPVFCDIDPDSFNLDPARVADAITERTVAILPVHVFGRPCDVDALQDVARAHGLPVVYDAAHTFGVRLRDRPLAGYGDMAVLSFHATKVYSTIEGGALVVHDEPTRRRVDELKDNGIVSAERISGPGLNGKMNEFEAAFGLVSLAGLPAEIEARRRVAAGYREGLGGVPGIRVPAPAPDTRPNFAYFPIEVDGEVFGRTRDELHAALAALNIHARKYFAPLCDAIPGLRAADGGSPADLPVARGVAARILCLPCYGGLSEATVGAVSAAVAALGPGA